MMDLAQNLLAALDARDESERQHSERERQLAADKAADKAKHAEAIEAAVAALASLEIAARVGVALQVYPRATGFKRKLAKAIGLTEPRVRFMLHSGKTVRCRKCGGEFPATQANFEASRWECETCHPPPTPEQRERWARDQEEYEQNYEYGLDFSRRRDRGELTPEERLDNMEFTAEEWGAICETFYKINSCKVIPFPGGDSA
jgi:hypothetical protein